MDKISESFGGGIIADWQKVLPVLVVLTLIIWIALFRRDPASEQSIFLALLIIYLVHQIEEHLWPGGFRQFTNARVFKSGDDNWPVTVGGVALVNIGFVWLPVAAAAIFPESLRWIGLGWIGLTLINGITHIASSLRFRIYNPGLVSSIVLFLPFTLWVLAVEAGRGALTGGAIALVIIAGVVLHIPVAALFVVPYRRGARSRTAPSVTAH